jgi:hypothetical protein
LTDSHYAFAWVPVAIRARSHIPCATAAMENPRAVPQDACSRIMLRETLKAAPIQVPLTPAAAARAGANLARQALAVLRPLTHPGKATPSATAVDAARLLQECILKLGSLDLAPPPAHKVVREVVPVLAESNPGRHNLHYVGPNWAPDRVIALRRKVDEHLEMPYADVQDYILDTVCADRQWTVARSYLAALHAATNVDGKITFAGRLYTRQQLSGIIPRMRIFQATRRNAAIKNTGHLFAREGVKTAKRMLGYSKWRVIAALKDRYKLR